MFLTRAEIEELTGYKRGKDQCAWLTDHGWVFEIDAHGRPKISVEYCRIRMGGQIEAPKRWQLKVA